MTHIDISSNNLAIQYTIVAVIVAAAAFWILWKILKKKNGKGDSCCGCSLGDKCNKAKEKCDNKERKI